MDRYVEEFDRPDAGDTATSVWHAGRIRFFVEQLRAGLPIDAIIVDNLCNRGNIYAVPIIVDGHHRLVASYIIAAPTIPAWYGGRVDLRDYLSGQRQRCPRD